jgi:hypothetical protein
MIQILPGRAGYPGTTQNFIRSADYPHAWDGNFAVLSAEDFDGGQNRDLTHHIVEHRRETITPEFPEPCDCTMVSVDTLVSCRRAVACFV